MSLKDLNSKLRSPKFSLMERFCPFYKLSSDEKRQKLEDKIATLATIFIEEAKNHEFFKGTEGTASFFFDICPKTVSVQIGNKWVDLKKVPDISEKEKEILSYINRISQAYFKRGLSKDRCMNPSEVSTPGLFAILSLPKGMKQTQLDYNESAKTGDKQLYKESVMKGTSQLISLGGSVCMISSVVSSCAFIIFGLATPLSPFVIAMGFICSFTACVIEAARQLIWIKFSSDAIHDLNYKPIQVLDEIATLLSKKNSQGKVEIRAEQIVDAKYRLKKAFALLQEDEKVQQGKESYKDRGARLYNQLFQLQQLFDSKGAVKEPTSDKKKAIIQDMGRIVKEIEQYVADLKSDLVERAFLILDKKAQDAKGMRTIIRQFGANYASNFAMQRDTIKEGLLDHTFQKTAEGDAQKFIRNAHRQSIKKIFMYSLALIGLGAGFVCLFIPGAHFIAIGLTVIGAVIAAFITYILHEKMVEKDGYLFDIGSKKRTKDFYKSLEMYRGIG